MTISAVDIFSIGIGPSSSHTVGPMRAAKRFAEEFNPKNVSIELRGSLSSTGHGHGTDRASVLGLAGYEPVTVPLNIDPKPGAAVPTHGSITSVDGKEISFHIIFNDVALPEHPNGMIFTVLDENDQPTDQTETYFSVGGGFIQSASELKAAQDAPGETSGGVATQDQDVKVPWPFSNGAEMLDRCERSGMSIPEIMMENEIALHGSEEFVNNHLDLVWDTMVECVEKGMRGRGILPGGLGVQRRCYALHQKLLRHENAERAGQLTAMEWVNLYAMAVNEENAAGGRVVTAPTNGAAGVIPAVMYYAKTYLPNFDREASRRFLLTAAAIGIVIKTNASISGAEVGCQGEVGSACAMAAAGLAELYDSTPAQVENAAEVALEHNLGLTCDPVGGLVQIPCIERNAIGAVKSINAARLARMGTGSHHVSLDDAVITMKETGLDMMSKYKETSKGGLAVNIGLPVTITEC